MLVSLDRYEERIYKALEQDLGKSREEAYITEIGIVRNEIRYYLRMLPMLAAPKPVATALYQQPACSATILRPKGVCLVISPWNYPLHLALVPLVAAIAAGNCVVVKPSEMAPATEQLLVHLLGETFPPELCRVACGGPAMVTSLLEMPFDHIFFTGSTRVGKIVLEKAAAQLIPVTLELGGKSPCIVDETADIPAAARRIAWGKGLNAGQTCVAPDVIYVHRAVKEQLVRELTKSFLRFYGAQPHQNPDYPKILNREHYDRLMALMAEGTVLAGGATEESTLKIAPTLVEGMAQDSRLMTEEIFGPLLPIIPYDTLDSVVLQINARPHPLAFYLFTRDYKKAHILTRQIPFGGGCINDTVAHLGSNGLPFGGIGASGMGQYHGRWGFHTFSHAQGIMIKPARWETQFRYPPHDGKLELFRLFLH